MLKISSRHAAVFRKTLHLLYQMMLLHGRIRGELVAGQLMSFLSHSFYVVLFGRYNHYTLPGKLVRLLPRKAHWWFIFSTLKVTSFRILLCPILTCLNPVSTVFAGGGSRYSYASYSQSTGRCRGAGNCHFRFFIFHSKHQNSQFILGSHFSPPSTLSELLERPECPPSTRYDLWYRGIFYESPTFEF